MLQYMHGSTMPIVAIAVLAYNAENNIYRLVSALTKQVELGYTLRSIIIYSDKSTDKTVEIVQNIKDKRVRVVPGELRIGFANAVKKVLNNIDSDIVVLLNDDIVIKDDKFISYIVSSFKDNVGLVSSNIIPLKTHTFVEKAVESGFLAYKNTAQKILDGNNRMTCDGKCLSLSRDLINLIKFPKNAEIMANVDLFLYLECLRVGKKYAYAKKSKLYFKFPSNTRDFIKWQTRNYASLDLLRKKFGKLADDETSLPRLLFSYYKTIEFVKNPIGSIYILFLGFYCSHLSKKMSYFNPLWDVVKSTKKLKNI